MGTRNGSAHTPAASSRRRLGNTTQRAEQAAWEAEHTPEENDPRYYLAEVAPKLSQFTITRIARATGMSTSSASKIRSGKQLPHPRHWKTLADLVRHGESTTANASSWHLRDDPRASSTGYLSAFRRILSWSARVSSISRTSAMRRRHAKISKLADGGGPRAQGRGTPGTEVAGPPSGDGAASGGQPASEGERAKVGGEGE